MLITARAVALSVLTLGLVGAAAVLSAGASGNSSVASVTNPAFSSPAPARHPDPYANAQVIAHLRRLSITPESLAAVGATPEQAAGVLTLAQVHLSAAKRDEIMSMQAGVDAAARRGTREGRLQTQAALDAEDVLVRAVISAALNPEQVEGLRLIHERRSWTVPMAYKLQPLPVGGYVALRDSLSRARQAGAVDMQEQPLFAVPVDGGAALEAIRSQWRAEAAVP